MYHRNFATMKFLGKTTLSPTIRNIYMKTLMAFITSLSVPLIILNMLGGIVSGIWLAILGEWGILLLGILLFVGGVWLDTFILTPGILLAIPAAYCAEKGKTLSFMCLSTLSNLYILCVVTIWCCGVLFLFVNNATISNLLPRLIWSYGVATGVWAYKASEDRESIASALTIFLAELAYLTIIFIVIFTPITLLQVIIIFASFMLVGLILQVVNSILIQKEIRERKLRAQPAELNLEEFQRQEENYRKKREADRPDREADLWIKPLTLEELQSVRHYILNELYKLNSTDWGYYALRFICNHSPKLSNLLIQGEINLEYIRNSEMRGIKDAIDIAQKVGVANNMTLRDYFHKIFEEIYKDTANSSANKFYYYGRNRVIEILRSYRASIKAFVPQERKFDELEGLELTLDTSIDTDIIYRVKDALDYFEKSARAHSQIEELKKQYQFKIESDYPIIEFDLEAIEKTGNLTYSGSLVNFLYNELKNLLSISADYTFLGYNAVSEPFYDALACSFAVEDGILVLVKYKGAVEYFPDRLYVELRDIDLNSWVMRWLKSYKMHLEGND